MKERARGLLLIVLAVVLSAAVYRIGHGASSHSRWIEETVATSVVCGALLALVVFLPSSSPLRRGWWPAVLLFAVLIRTAVWIAPYDLTEDTARYHWDGKVLASGVNPYRYPPDAPELSFLVVDELDEKISERSRRTLTVYPPLAQWIFAAAYRLTPGRTIGLRVFWLLAEITAWLLLAHELARRELPASRLLLVAWSPLLIFQGYLPGHVDLLLMPLVVLFLVAVDRRRPGAAGFWMALLLLVKPLPIVLLPAAWKELGHSGMRRFAAVGALTLVLFYLPFAGAGWSLFSSTWLMARTWSFNGSVTPLLEEWLPMGTAHVLAGALLLLAILGSVRHGGDLLGRCLLIAGAFVVFSSTLFPWYVVWFLPLLVLRPDPALIALTVLIPLADLVLPGYIEERLWVQPVWTRFVEYGVFFALLTVGFRRGWGMFARGDQGTLPRSLAAKT